MRRLICIAVIVAVAGLAGCAKQEPAPVEETSAPAADAEPISEETFESGEPETLVEGTEAVDESAADPAAEPHEETP